MAASWAKMRVGNSAVLCACAVFTCSVIMIVIIFFCFFSAVRAAPPYLHAHTHARTHAHTHTHTNEVRAWPKGSQAGS